MSENIFQDHEPTPEAEKLTTLEKLQGFFLENPKRKKSLLNFGIFLSFLLSLGYFSYFTQETIRLGGVTMTLVVSDPEYQRYLGKRYGFDYHVMVERNGDSVLLTYIIGQQEPQTFTLDADYAMEGDISSHIVQFHTQNGIYKPDTYDHYQFIHQKTQIRGDGYFLLFAVLFFFVWLIHLRYPLLDFQMRNFGMVDNGEPSDLYYFSRNICLWIIIPLCFFGCLFMAVYP